MSNDTPIASRKSLLAALKRHYGYSTFRPMQEEIIRDALAGRDVFALLPTGGGKSLCFQLPAIMDGGLTLVVSPLIALMKDQVDALTASGIPATFLNSSLEKTESRSRLSGIARGQYRLLYMAPERLMLSGFQEMLPNWNVRRIAIDEAHCISEWGHDFRPEYRKLATLREHVGQIPLMALTATATERVRSDIVTQLGLVDPGIYVASFNRPNLSYRVIPKNKPFDQVLKYVKERKKECGIIYCMARRTADSIAERLASHGIKALPYHAGLEPEVRRKNQELFIRDEVSVMCATIAFGMGINKPNVRYVIHYDLPKNIEGYYQETGRAGRDGLPSECVLLFSPSDAVKQQQFIEEKTDPDEQRIAQTQLRQMVHFSESSDCRRAELLSYFAEVYPEPNCKSCDNCETPRETFDGTVSAQKFLSCIVRIRQSTPNFGVGMNHLVDVLLGSVSERIQKWGHDGVSTFGIGREHSRQEWQTIGRQLIRLGYCKQTLDKFPVIEITAEGLLFLKSRTSLMLARPMKLGTSKEPRRGEIPCDDVLFERLRVLRKSLADARGVPAYHIFSDVTLRLMARYYPVSHSDFSRISGVGVKKLEEFGLAFADAVKTHLAHYPKRTFQEKTGINHAVFKSNTRDIEPQEEPGDEDDGGFEDYL